MNLTKYDIFFKVLSDDFEEIHWLSIPKWAGLNDSLYIMKRKNLCFTESQKQ